MKLPFDVWAAGLRWSNDDGMLLSAATAFYAIFSLFPLLLVLTAILGFVLHFSPDAQGAQQELLHIISENVSAQFADYLRNILQGVRINAGVGGPIGLVALLFGAMGMFTQVDAAFHRIWRIPMRRDRWFAPVLFLLLRRVRSLLLLLATGGLVIASYLSQPILAGVRAAAEHLPFAPGAVWAANTLIVAGLNVLLLMVIYRVLPKAKVEWIDALIGAALTTFLWNIIRIVLSKILAQSHYSAYGLFGAVIVVMLWFYIASGIFYLGAEYIAVVGRVPERRPETPSGGPVAAEDGAKP